MKRLRSKLRFALLLGLLSGSQVQADDKVTPGGPPPRANPVLIDLDSIRSMMAGGGNSKNVDSNDPAKYRPYTEVVANATKHEGMLTLFQKEDHLFAEIRPDQFDQPMLSPITIARGLAMAGNPLNFGDEWVIAFHRSGDKVQLIRRNTHVKAPMGTPLDKAVKQNYTDSILLALPIVALNQGNGNSVVIDLADLYFSNFAQLPMGSLDRGRTTWSKVKAYPNNLELEVQATFEMGGFGGYGYYFMSDDGVIDQRGVTVVIHYSLVKMPDAGYHPRAADDRVGHFLNATKDFGNADPDGNVVRMINRWRLEKADPKAKLSPPKKQIVWYIEDNVPLEYRSAVESGIREWNKAFEKIGFRDAIAVRWQEPGRDEFDPEDINYCTFRWITTSSTYAMSCLRSNPITGEMIDGDVIFDASWVRYWKNEYAVLTGEPPVAMNGDKRGFAGEPLGFGEVISSTLAAKQGYGNQPLTVQPNGMDGGKVTLAPAGWSGMHRDLLKRISNGERSSCRFAVGMQTEIGLAAMVLEEAIKDDPASKLPEEFLNQLIKEVVMHEVGHSLGLRHNFKASTMLDADQINNTEITRVKGLTGSVMDYNPINIVPKGQKQGDFMSTTIGPYDYWAIEYAYKEVVGDEAAELKKVAARAPEHDLVFGTDSDFYNADPLVNVYDLGSDVRRFAQDRITLAAQLLKNLDGKVVKDGDSWSRANIAFSYLLRQYGNAADLVASYVGGQSVSRHHKGDKDALDPIAPIPGDKQRGALTFLAENLWSDTAFYFSPALLRKLSKEHWDMGVGSSGFGMMMDSPVNDRVLGIQKIALTHCLSGAVLSRLQQQELQAEPDSKPLLVAEVFDTLSGAIFAEVGLDPKKPLEAGKPATVACSTIRRNLQREYFRRLATIVIGQRQSSMSDYYPFIFFMGGGQYPADAKSLARFHLKKIGDQLAKVLDTKNLTMDDTCRAHFEELRENVAKILRAEVSKNEP